MGFDTRTMSLAHSEAKLLPQLQFHVLKSSLTSYIPSAAFLTFRLIWGFWKWSPVISHNPKHGVFWTMSVACSEAELFLKLGLHFWKSSLTPYSPFTLFLTFRSIWGSSKWSQMIHHIQNHWVRHPNQLYSPFCTCSSQISSLRN